MGTRVDVGTQLARTVKNGLFAFTHKIHAKIEAWLAFGRPSVSPILVYQMGKVGSSTVYRSLKEANLPNPVLHVHFLSDELPKRRESHKKDSVAPVPYHIYLGEAIRRAFMKNPGNQLKLISLVREPIAFVISNFFQNPRVASVAVKTKGGDIDSGKLSLYLEELLSQPSTLAYVNSWFDRELKEVFGIDVFAAPFPCSKGHAVYRRGVAEALVIRLEDLSRVGPRSVANFLGLDEPLVFKQTHITSRSSQGATYEQAKRNIRLSTSLCRRIYSCKFTEHFYSKTDIENFIMKWTQG